MKLCSICDRKIDGTWCKTCHRFVKTYELPEGIHFNESHDPANDANCTYHTGGSSQRSTTTGATVARSGSTTATRQTYTQTTTQSRTGTGTGKKKKGKGKLVVILVVLYFLFNLIGGLIPTITNCAGALSEEFKESFREEEKKEDPFRETPEQETGLAYEEKLAAMDKLTPLDETEGDGYVFKYYDPRDIVTLGFACDEAHFDMTVPEFDEWLEENWLDEYELEEGISEYTNYYYEGETSTWLSFCLYRDYYADEEFSVRVDYDTATQKLHGFGFAALNGWDETELYYAALKEFDPETEWTQSFFKNNMKDALGESGEESVTFYSSDVLQIEAQQGDGYYAVTFYPAYE